MPNYRKLPGLKGRLVTVEVSEHTRISKTARFGTGVKLRGSTRIAAGVEIGNGCTIESSDIGAGVIAGPGTKITLSIVGAKSIIGSKTTIFDSIIRKRVTVGDDAYLSDGVVVEDEARIGDYVQSSRYIIRTCVVIGHSTDLHSSLCGENEVAPFVRVGAECGIFGTNLPRNLRIGHGTQVFNAVLGSPVAIGNGVRILEGVTIPDNWELPDGVTVNPNPYGGPPVVIPAPPVGLERQVAELREQLASLQKRLVGYGL